MATIENAIQIKIEKYSERPFESDRQVDETQPIAESIDMRGEFWEAQISNTGASSSQAQYREISQSIEYWEAKVFREFGTALLQQLVEGYRKTFGQMNTLMLDEKIELLSNVAFKVKNLSYSSLLLGLDIAGVEYLVKAFNNNFDTFRIFLEGFIHPAFAVVVGSQFANQLTYSLTSYGKLQAEFEKGAGANKAPSNTKGKGIAEFVWGLINTSLIVPVLLALLIMLIAFQETNNARNQYNTALQAVIDQQSQLLEIETKRLEACEASQELLIRQWLSGLQDPALSQPLSTPGAEK